MKPKGDDSKPQEVDPLFVHSKFGQIYNNQYIWKESSTFNRLKTIYKVRQVTIEEKIVNKIDEVPVEVNNEPQNVKSKAKEETESKKIDSESKPKEEEIQENKIQINEKDDEKHQEKSQEDKETKLINKEVPETIYKIQAFDHNGILDEFNYEDCFKYFHLKVRVLQKNSKPMVITLDVDINDNFRNITRKIKSEYLKHLSSETYTFYINKQEIQFIDSFEFDNEWIKQKKASFLESYEKLLQEEKERLAMKFKIEEIGDKELQKGEENQLPSSEPEGEGQKTKHESTKTEKEPVKTENKLTKTEKEPVKTENKQESKKAPIQTSSDKNENENQHDKEPIDKYHEKIEAEISKNFIPLSEMSYNKSIYTSKDLSGFVKVPENVLTITNEAQIAHLLQFTGGNFVLDICLTNKSSFIKNLKIAQTFEKVLISASHWPSLKFSPSHTIILRGFSLYGPCPQDISLPGFNFYIRGLNLNTKQTSFSLCKQIGGLPKHRKYFFEQPLIINVGDWVDIRPIKFLKNKAKSNQTFTNADAQNTTDLDTNYQNDHEHKTLFHPVPKKSFENFDLNTNGKVTKGYGTVYKLWSSTGISYGQDEVKFSIVNREDIGVSGLYYEQLTSDKKRSLKKTFRDVQKAGLDFVRTVSKMNRERVDVEESD